eukprot:scaffold19970_cov15-Prasinocladus_malaysianus.AAC.1
MKVQEPAAHVFQGYCCMHICRVLAKFAEAFGQMLAQTSQQYIGNYYHLYRLSLVSFYLQDGAVKAMIYHILLTTYIVFH